MHTIVNAEYLVDQAFVRQLRAERRDLVHLAVQEYQRINLRLRILVARHCEKLSNEGSFVWQRPIVSYRAPGKAQPLCPGIARSTPLSLSMRCIMSATCCAALPLPYTRGMTPNRLCSFISDRALQPNHITDGSAMHIRSYKSSRPQL
jgi:hypothetical protein